MGQNMNLNQFSQTPIKGDSATKVNLNTLSVQVDPDSVAMLLPGDAVVLVTADGNTIIVDKAVATDNPFGYVFYSIKKDHFTAGDAMEIGLVGAIMYVQAQGSIDRGGNVEYLPSSDLTIGPRVKAAAGVNPESGLALDNAADGDILRMIVLGSASYQGDAVITSGSINNTPIGQSTAAAGAFTVLTASTSLTVSGATISTTLADAIVALTPGVAVSLNPALGGLFTLVPAQTCTINAASVPTKHQRIVIVVTTSGTTAYTITFGTSFKSTGTLSTGVTTAKVFVLTFEGDGTTFNEASRTTAM